MNTQLILIDTVLSIVAIVGLFALTLPDDKYSRMLERAALVGKGNTIAGGAQRRLIGVALILFGAFGLSGQFPPARETAQTAPAPNALNALTGSGADLLPLLLGLLVVGAGFFVAFNPELLMRWSLRKLFPNREIPAGYLRTCEIALRIAGAAIIYASKDLLMMYGRR